MKILLLYSYNQGYLSGFFTEVARLLAADGHAVTCFCLKGKRQRFTRDGVTFHIEKKGGYLNNYGRIYAVLKEVRPELVLSNFSYVNPALLFGRWFGVKQNMVWFHSLNEQMEATRSNIAIKALFLRLAQRVIANSHLTAAQLEQVYGVAPEKCCVLPFWTPLAAQEVPATESPAYLQEGKLAIGCPGRMAVHKNQRVVLEAVSLLRQTEGRDFHVYFAGDGEEFLSLQARVRELQLEDRVTFLKHLSAADMEGFYKAMDVVVLPSLHEAFGLVFIEALSLGVPVLVSRRFGALTFIDSGAPLLEALTFAPESAAELAEKLQPFRDRPGTDRQPYLELYRRTFSKKRIYEQLTNCMGL